MNNRVSWMEQVVRIENKGRKAFLDGVPQTECPYQTGYGNQLGAGGGLQRLRRAAWKMGWQTAAKERDEEG